MKLVFAGGEAVPFCKTGGLADVMGALPAALALKKHTIVRFLPLYQDISTEQFQIEDTGLRFSVPLRATAHAGEIWKSTLEKNPVTYFLKFDPYFGRPGLYGALPNTAYSDNDERYAFYARGVLEALKKLKFKPDVIHCHDWQAGLIPAYLKSIYKSDAWYSRTAAVFTIHNMAYQGIFPKEMVTAAGFSWDEFTVEGLEFYDQMNYLKGGLAYADAINTVSPTYAREIMSDPGIGYGLDGFIRHRSERFRGIVNGIDEEFWDPSSDGFIKANFDAARLDGRRACREDLIKRTGLKLKPGAALVSFIGRLDHHKGVSVLLNLAPDILKLNLGLVFLGSGDVRYQKALNQLKAAHPGRVFVENKFAEELAHAIYAGSDLLLMPSRFEPCGLTQMIAQRYGALPVVSPTGGLVDTVISLNSTGAVGSGFIAKDMSEAAFMEALKTAVEFLEDKTRLKKTISRVMKISHSWDASTPDYLQMYKQAVQWRAKR